MCVRIFSKECTSHFETYDATMEKRQQFKLFTKKKIKENVTAQIVARLGVSGVREHRK